MLFTNLFTIQQPNEKSLHLSTESQPVLLMCKASQIIPFQQQLIEQSVNFVCESMVLCQDHPMSHIQPSIYEPSQSVGSIPAFSVVSGLEQVQGRKQSHNEKASLCCVVLVWKYMASFAIPHLLACSKIVYKSIFVRSRQS